MKRNRKILIIIFSLLFTIIGGTFAWFTYTSRETALVLTIGNINDTKITVNPYQINDTVLPVNVYTSGVSSQVEVINNSSAPVSVTLYYRINELSLDLIDNGLKYTIVKSSTKDGTYEKTLEGDFTEYVSGEELTLFETTVAAQTTEYYKVYIWLDSSAGNQSSIQKSVVNVELNASMVYLGSSGPEAPVLDTNGMIPVTIAADGTTTTISSTDSSWYNYENKEWANAVLVDSTTRSNYLNTTGVTISQDDILAYYVWVPRYKYMIPQTKCSTLENPTIESNPECFAPYTVSDEGKTKLMEYWVDYWYCDELSYYEEEAAEQVEYALSTGKFLDGLTLNDAITSYNNGESSCGMISPSGTIEVSSEFNGDNSVSGTETSIDIEFESASSAMSLGDAQTSYRTHPAFVWDGQTIAGIWVGKFETSANQDSTCYTSNSTANCVPSNVSPRIVPNAKSLRYQTVSNQFTTSQKFSATGNAYGLSNTSTNAHMMKNSEWGAVAYLSHSEYGINGEIYINNSSSYFTGRSGGNVGGSNNQLKVQFSGSSTSTARYNSYGYYTWTGQTIAADGTVGDYAEDRTLGTNASSTGNVTGVYDMSGGAWEYVMGNYKSTIGSAGFSTLPDSKYYDLYSAANPLVACNGGICYGDALWETATWYSDYAVFVSSDWPWFRRGGAASAGAGAGAFVFAGGVGVASRGARCLLSGTERSDLLFSDNVVTM